MEPNREVLVASKSGRRIAVSFYGQASAPPVVLVHASGLSSRAWQRHAERLESSFQPVVVDLLGYGKSDVVPFGEPVSAEDDLDALGALLGSLPASAHVIGHSYGGYLAAKLALGRPERVSSLCLIEPVLFGALRQTADPEAADELAQLYDDPQFLDDSFGGSEGWMQRFIDYWGGKGGWAALPDGHRRANMRVSWKVYREVKDLSSDPLPFDAYAALPEATTLVRGGSTTVCARRIIDFLAAELPRAKVRVIEGAGHMSPISHPGEVIAVLEEHLRR